MKDSRNFFRKIGLIGIGLCAACCTLPIVGVMFGVGTLTVIGAYIEWVGIVAAVVAMIFFGVYYLKKKSAPACDVDCACKESKAEVKS